MENESEPPSQGFPAATIRNQKLNKENLRFPVAPNRQTSPSSSQQLQQHRSEPPEKPRSPFPSWMPLSTSSTARVASATTPASSSATTTPSKRSSNTNRTHQQTPPSSSSSQHQHFYNRLTPPGTSKLLRDHFGKLSLLASANNATNTPSSINSSCGSGNGTQRKRRLLDSGAVRLIPPHATPTATPTATAGSSSPLPSLSPMPSPCRRIGFDGTHLTPSRELLKSTVSSRNQRAVAPVTSNESHPSSSNAMNEEDNSSTDRTINSSDHNGPAFTTSATSAWISSSNSGYHHHHHYNDPSVSIPVVLTAKLPNGSGANHDIHNFHNKMSRRVDCGDPVAWTLWKGGEEDSPWLLEQDRRVVPKVSSNLSDIYGDTTTAELARPIPVVATQQFYRQTF